MMMKIWWMRRELSFLEMIRSTDSAMKTPTNRRTRRSADPETIIIRSCRVKESLFKTNNIDKQRMPTNVVLHFLLDWNLLKCVVNRMIMKIIHNREYQWNIFLQLLIFCITIVKMFIVREFLSLVGADPVSRDILLSWSCRCEVTHFYQGFCTLFHCYLFNVKTVGNSKDFDDKICHTISWIRHNILILIPANNMMFCKKKLTSLSLIIFSLTPSKLSILFSFFLILFFLGKGLHWKRNAAKRTRQHEVNIFWTHTFFVSQYF